ncbi:MAG: right-handed parallel beta-helix repeat-containing protein [Anaerolineae bacterium]
MASLQRWFRLALVIVLALSATPIVFAAPAVQSPTTGSFIVNTLADSNTFDNFLSLREAILVANGSLTGTFTDAEKAQLGGCTFTGSTNSWTISGGCGGSLNDTIAFSVVGTINLNSALPDINDTAALEITGPAYGLNSITVNGSALSIGVTLLNITSHGNTLQQLNFANSHGFGVRVAGSNNLVLTNYFYGHADHALVLDGGGLNQISFNVFGQAPAVTPPAACNAAERNSASNIVVRNGSVQNTLNNNYLTCALGHGLWLRDAATANNLVAYNLAGGMTTAWGNNGSGVYISHGSHDNRIDQNNLGRNLQAGVTIASANANIVQQNSIGFKLSGEVMGNSVSGVELLAGASSNQILTNTIAHNGVYGVQLADTNTRFNIVRANTIMTNTVDGIRLENGPQFNSIGSPIGGPRAQGNVVSGNGDNGIRLVDETTAYNWVLGNNVGLNADQTAAQPNSGAGIVVDGAVSNIIGITNNDGNVIAGNLKDGLALIGGAHANSVQGNLIGVNSTNTQLLPNGWSGVAIMLGAHSNIIGSGTGNNLNLISHSTRYGVYIAGTGTTTNTVSNNNIYGSGWDGITIQDGASNNTIGSSTHNERNLIADGSASGIYVTNANANRILGDGIWNNAYYGIILDGAATTGTYISRTAVFQNGYDGIGERNGATFNVWTEISAYANNGLGIDKQATGDLDNIVTAPTAKITSVSTVGGITTLQGTGLNGSLVEVYGVAPDNSGFGEGKTYLGTATISSGHWTLNVSSSAASRFTLIENVLGIASSEFGANTCRVMLPTVVK